MTKYDVNIYISENVLYYDIIYTMIRVIIIMIIIIMYTQNCTAIIKYTSTSFESARYVHRS